MTTLAQSSKSTQPQNVLLEQIWMAPGWHPQTPARLPHYAPQEPEPAWAAFTREFSIGEASFILMAAFFLSAALGSVRQILFNAQFGVSAEANAYYAAFRLPDTLFSLMMQSLKRLHAALFTASPEAIKKSAKLRPEAAMAADRITGGYSKDVPADWREVEAKLNEVYSALK